MPHPLAITRNRQALFPIVAAIVALLGGREGLIQRGLRRAALALLRPAESAVRRLIVIATQGLALPPEPARPFPAGLAGAWRAAGGDTRRPAFRLFDPPQTFARLRPAPPAGVPRIRSFGGFAPLIPLVAAPPPPAPTPRPEPPALVEARPVLRRLAALEGALADLPRQARRMARRLARERAHSSHPSPQRRRRSPLRIGRPPGWRRAAERPVDQVLRECHGLALDVLRADTS